MNTNLKKLQSSVAELKKEIVNHRVYSEIRTLNDLKIFMQYHVFAVWDFMSLLKSLQINLTCTSIPWFPKGAADTRFLINEIVAGEESDIDKNGVRKSHFEMYLEAMQQCGADTKPICDFIDTLQQTGDFQLAFTTSGTPLQAQKFMNFTFKTIADKKDHVTAAVFTFGREDLIPGMFISIVSDINSKFPESISKFKYYLERHIEVDGDHHSHLALEMTSQLCKNDDELWGEAQKSTIEALQQRIFLWDAALAEIQGRKIAEIADLN